jgi:patatin-like phospholipase/acyl hydrolase
MTGLRRILSIDGGGIKGVFPAAFLAAIEDDIGSPVADYFDLIVGTSTGGVIALGLGLGFSSAEILHFYEHYGPTIFRSQPLLGPLRSVIAPRYSPAPLERALREQFGERRLGESKKRLVIPSLDLEAGEVYIYKTAHHPRFQRDYKASVVDVALATAAAPTYFPAHRLGSGTPLIDGGVWANNPTGLAVVEAIGTLGWAAESLRVLSLGCTTTPVGSKRGALSFGLGGWGLRIVDFFLAAQSSASLGTAYVLVGHANVRRVSPVVAKDRFALDRASEIPSLRGLGSSEARRELPILLSGFFSEPAEVFKPNHAL